MKINLAKAISLGKKPFVTSQKGRVGVGFVEEEKKKESFMKDARAPQAKKVNIASGGATRGKTTSDDFAGKSNPHYIYMLIIMGISMLSLLVLEMCPLLVLFGLLRPLLLTNEDPLQNGDLNQSNDFL